MNSTKIAELIAIAAGLFIIYRLWQQRQVTAASISTNIAAGGAPFVMPAGATSVTPAGTLPGQPGYGWQYFSDGTAIDPSGAYYANGVKVYDPMMSYGGQMIPT